MKTFSIGTFGFSKSEMSMLERAFSFTVLTKRIRAYELKEDISSSPPDIIMLNIDSPSDIQQWENYKAQFSADNIPYAGVSSKIPKKSPYQIRLPFYANRVLKVLDEITIKELGYVPELTIGDNDAPSKMGVMEVATLDTETTPNSRPVSREEEEATGEVIVTRGERAKVLVADNDEAAQNQLSLSLNLLGIKADYTDSGEQVLQLIHDKTYDAVVLNTALNGLDGYHVCKAIRKDPDNSGIPVIMLAEHNNALVKFRCQKAGCTVFAAKPLTYESFKNIAQQYIH